ncbi:hypothetical protein V2W30_27885 [Streptomyces sp. Q6]|uniref:Uncharacterized protein n=1 Tax=Streptomyces citrinus TaxID=3118173 RepID=A0ACD5AIT0_9ACTN
MNLEQRSTPDIMSNSDQRMLTFLVGFFTTICTFATVTHVLQGSIKAPLIGVDLVLLYGFYLAVQGWRRRETQLSCAALLVLPGLFLAAYLSRHM